MQSQMRAACLTAVDTMYFTPQPCLEIVHQPASHYPFRYEKEIENGKGKRHGVLPGAEPGTFPTVKLSHYEDEAKIVCSLLTYIGDQPYPNVHRIVCHESPDEREVFQSVMRDKGYRAVFDNLIILRKGKDSREKNSPHKVKLLFEAKDVKSMLNICEPVFSTMIAHTYNASVGRLGINKMSFSSFSCEGGAELILLVEKVSMKNLKVCFTEENWEADGEILYSHHQYALGVRVPPYKNQEITDEVVVKIQLKREEDRLDISKPVDFTYLPNRKKMTPKRMLPQGERSPKRRPTDEALGQPNLLSIDRVNQRIENIHIENQGTMPCEEREIITYPTDDISSELFEKFLNNSSWQLDDLVAEYSSPNTKDKYDLREDVVVSDGCSKLSRAPPTSLLGSNGSRYNCIEQNQEKDSTLGSHKHTFGTSKYLESQPQSDKAALEILHYAALYGKEECLSEVLECIKRNKQQELLDSIMEADTAPLITAVQNNNVGCIKLLCEAGANINIGDINENTALHVAAKKNHVKCLELLLSLSPIRKVNKKNFKGETAFHLAVMHNNLECVKILLDAGAELNLRTGTAGQTALHLAAASSNQDLINFLLQQEGINVNEVDFAGKIANLPDSSEEKIIGDRSQNTVESGDSSGNSDSDSDE